MILRWADGDSQLGFVGVGSGVGHAQHTPARVGQVGAELILEGLPPKGLASCNTREREKERKENGSTNDMISILLSFFYAQLVFRFKKAVG